MKCSMCRDQMAEVMIGWPRCDGTGRAVAEGKSHAVCGACAASVWAQISTKFSGTEACMSFCIRSILEAA